MSWAGVIPGWIVGSMAYLLVGGLLIRGALALALRLARPRWARARYLMALGAFLAAVLLPLLTYSTAVATAYAEQRPLLLTWSEPETALELGPAKDREAWLSWLAAGEPASYFVKIWLGGVLLLSLPGLVAAASLLWLRRSWRPAPTDLRRRLDWPADQELLIAEEGVPLALGVLRPAALLPLWLFERLDTQAVRSIARHELAHLRWRDPLVDFAMRLTRTVLWPSFGLRLIEQVVRREREAAADLEALGSASENPQAVVDYAETLTAVATRATLGFQGLRAGHALGAMGELEDRVGRLLTPGHSQRPWQLPAALAILVIGSLAVNAFPFPQWLDAPTDETAVWGPLDHLLGFNPAISTLDTPDGPRVKIQGHILDAEASWRWQQEQSLSQLAITVLEAEQRSLGADPQINR